MSSSFHIRQGIFRSNHLPLIWKYSVTQLYLKGENEINRKLINFPSEILQNLVQSKCSFVYPTAPYHGPCDINLIPMIFEKSLGFPLLGLHEISFAWKSHHAHFIKACPFFKTQEALKCYLLTDKLTRAPQLRDFTDSQYIILMTLFALYLCCVLFFLISY